MATFRDTDRAALVKLLGDDDPRVLQLLEEKFAEMGEDGLAFLASTANGGDEAAAHGAKQILGTIRQRDAEEAFAKFCATSGSNFDLEHACWLLARTRYHELDERPYRA